MELVAQTFPFAKYKRQQTIGVHINSNSLSVSAGGTLANNTYKWYMNSVLVSEIKGDSVFTATMPGR